MSYVLDAARALVRRYPGGARSLAPRLHTQKSGETLAREVAGAPMHKLALVDAVEMSVLSADMGILNAFASECGCMVLPLPDGALVGDDVMQRVGAAAKEFGEFVSAITTNAADGSISLNDVRQIEKEGGELMAAVQQLMAHLRAMHEAEQAARGVFPGAGGAL